MTAAANAVEDLDRLAEKLVDRVYRLNNLYFILDKEGAVVQFRMNRAQRKLLKRMHHRNVILKARQLGFSTFIQLYMLDRCLFNSNQHAGVIAQDLDKAEDIFTNKLKFAFDRLPEALRQALAPKQDSARQMRFANGSTITVGTSMRSGTLQMLHVSEMGKIAAKRPDKAREIVTGSFEAVPQSGVIWVESTAEGREGAFFDLVKRSRDIADAGRSLAQLDWAFHFFPWWMEPGYRADTTNVVIHPHLERYFADLETKYGIKLELGQRAWYALKQRDLGDDIKREHPSHPDEAFEVAVEGAYYASAFRTIRRDRRITLVPHTEGLPVHTGWDLGMNDATAIWFCQVLGREVRLIDYFEDQGEGLAYYARILNERASEKGYFYGRHFAPHDIEVRELGTGVKRIDTAASHGIMFEAVPRVSSNPEGREAVRQFLPMCYFDESACVDGIKALEHYRRAWDERKGAWGSQPLHDWASHGAKAFETLARTDLFGVTVPGSHKVEQVPLTAWS